MNCRETEHLVQAYVDNTIPQDKIEEFIEHINHCPSCYDELETYYIIYFSMKYLDGDSHVNYDMKQMLNEDLKKKLAKAKSQKRKKGISYVVIGILVLLLLICIAILVMPMEVSEIPSQVMNLFGL